MVHGRNIMPRRRRSEPSTIATIRAVITTRHPDLHSSHCAGVQPRGADRAGAVARWRIGLGLTAAMTVIYVGFILLIAYDKELLATVIAPGLSVGIVLGALVIVAAWALILIYVRWANRTTTTAVRGIRTGGCDERRRRRTEPDRDLGLLRLHRASRSASPGWAARRTEDHRASSSPPAAGHRLPERPRARRRLHERRELPRHRRPGRAFRASTA